MPKYYHRTPGLDSDPLSPATLKLGNIFSSLRTLTSPLNKDDYVSVPSHLITDPKSLLNFSDTKNARIEVSGGVFAEVAQGLLGGGELIYTFARDKGHSYCCKSLETVEFEPDERFVDDCIKASQRVQQFIADSFLGNKKVYMITGLKIATGLSARKTANQEHGPELRVGLDGSLIGAPVQAGPQLGVMASQRREIAYGPLLSEVVFAYRAIKISPKRSGNLDIKDISGGQYSVEDESDGEEDEGWNVEVVDERDLGSEFPDSVEVKIERQNINN